MESTKAFELKVGMFILTGIVILFVIVFSIGDIDISKKGYKITVLFNFASGIGSSAPVRLAGVGVGRVDGLRVVYSEKDKKTYAEVDAWIQEGTKIENDASITINTLGLLGEKYLEVLPGTPGAPILSANSTIVGHDPVMMEKVTENLVNITEDIVSITGRLKKGEGTIGKLLTEDEVYENLKGLLGNLEGFSEKLNSGQGTVGKLLTDDKIYKELEAFVADLKKHPWKLLSKPRGE